MQRTATQLKQIATALHMLQTSRSALAIVEANVVQAQNILRDAGALTLEGDTACALVQQEIAQVLQRIQQRVV